MISAGTYHKAVPKGRAENLGYRRWLYKQCKSTVTRKAVLAMCRDDFLFWVNSFVIQYNPLKGGYETGPFVTWDFQDEAASTLLWCIRNKKSAVIEKSREMGGTYLCLLVFLWCALFHRYKKFVVISRSAEAVDSPGESDSVFWKIEDILDHLPDWMKGLVRRRKMSFNFARTESRITGYASTGISGVGGRATAMLMDEFSLVKEDTTVRQKTASTTDCRIFNGTHQGPGTEFFNLCQQPEFIKIKMHWSQHPDKKKGLYRSGVPGSTLEILDRTYEFPPDFQFVADGKPSGGPFPGIRSPWYDWKSRDIGDERGVAMELDMDAKGSVSQIIDPMLVRELRSVYGKPPLWEGDLAYDRGTGEPHRLIPRKAGIVKLWILPDPQGYVHKEVYFFGTDVSTGKGVTNSCLTGLDSRGKKVLEVATPFMKEDDFAVLTVALCRLFASSTGEGAQLCWERLGCGETFGLKILELRYHRLWYRSDENRWGKELTEVPGWLPTVNTTRNLIKDYFEALFTRNFINHSEMALEECLDWKFDAQGQAVHGGKISCKDPSGAGVNHGDRTIADAIAWLLCKPHYFRAKKPENQEAGPDTLAFRKRQRQNARQQQESWG